MRKKSKAVQIQENRERALRTERDVYQRLATILFHSTGPDAMTYDAREIVKDEDRPDELYEYRLYDSTRANGGIVVMLNWVISENRAIINADILDDWYLHMKDLPYGSGIGASIKVACDNLFAARNKIVMADQKPLIG